MDSRNDFIRDFLGVTAWHKAGYTGRRGLTASGEDFEAAEYNTDHAVETRDAFHEIAPGRKVIHLKLRDVDELITEAAAQRVDTMFVSLSTTSFSTASRKKIDEDLPPKTTIFVSAGNYGDERYNHYMKPERIYGVGAVYMISDGTPMGKHVNGYYLDAASYTSASELVDFGGITGLYLEGNRSLTGTSCACPVICGMAALVNDFFIAQTGRPLTDKAMYRFLQDCTIDLEGVGKDDKTGWGIPILPDPDTIDIDKYREASDMVYKDDSKINHSHKEDVYRAYELGIMSGHNGSFDPKAPLTREQMASVAVRLYDAIKAAKK